MQEIVIKVSQCCIFKEESFEQMTSCSLLSSCFDRYILEKGSLCMQLVLLLNPDCQSSQSLARMMRGNKLKMFAR